MAMVGKVRRMHFRQNRSVREIARATSLSRNTVRKYLRLEQLEEPKYRRAPMPTKLTPFYESVRQALPPQANLHASPGSCIHAGMSRWPCSTRQTSTWSGCST